MFTLILPYLSHTFLLLFLFTFLIDYVIFFYWSIYYCLILSLDYYYFIVWWFYYFLILFPLTPISISIPIISSSALYISILIFFLLISFNFFYFYFYFYFYFSTIFRLIFSCHWSILQKHPKYSYDLQRVRNFSTSFSFSYLLSFFIIYFNTSSCFSSIFTFFSSLFHNFSIPPNSYISISNNYSLYFLFSHFLHDSMFILYGSIIIFLYLLSNFDDLASLSFLYHRPSPLPPLPYFLCHCLLPLMVCHILHSIISPLSFFTLFYLFISLSLSLSFSLFLSLSLSHAHTLSVPFLFRYVGAS